MYEHIYAYIYLRYTYIYIYIYIYITTLPVSVIVRLPYPRSRYSQGHKTFLAPSADNQTGKYDTEYSKHRPFLSTLTSEGLSCNKMK